MLEAFSSMGVKALSDQVVCFSCGKYFRNVIPNNYPHSCLHCGRQFDERLTYCMPDILFYHGEKIGIVYVNGKIHYKDRVRKKDKEQIRLLRLYGYTPFIIKNETINNSENFILRSVVFGFYNALVAEWLYKKFLDGEKELYGL